ncbi:hypothetical protein ACFV0T_37955 [Streptomyces sp. NPDC059582]
MFSFRPGTAARWVAPRLVGENVDVTRTWGLRFLWRSSSTDFALVL